MLKWRFWKGWGEERQWKGQEATHLVLLAVRMKRLCSSLEIPQGAGRRAEKQDCIVCTELFTNVSWGQVHKLGKPGRNNPERFLRMWKPAQNGAAYPCPLPQTCTSTFLKPGGRVSTSWRATLMSRSIQIHPQFPMVIYIFLFRTLGCLNKTQIQFQRRV